ncbi:histidine kinase [Hydrogenophaga sp. T2]|uniref:histidine kinase n=1 Tax=Hydrogenophaga sp. T2 TaxID=3132823 RepID=UPI003CE91EED
MNGVSLQVMPPQLLLVEPDNLVRNTVAGVCRELELAQVHQAASLSVGVQMLQAQAMDLLLLSLSEADAAIDLIERLRAGGFSSAPDAPVAVMAVAADATTVQRLKALKIRRLLLQPFKIHDVVHTVEALCAHVVPPASAQTLSGSTSTA